MTLWRLRSDKRRYGPLDEGLLERAYRDTIITRVMKAEGDQPAPNQKDVKAAHLAPRSMDRESRPSSIGLLVELTFARMMFGFPPGSKSSP